MTFNTFFDTFLPFNQLSVKQFCEILGPAYLGLLKVHNMCQEFSSGCVRAPSE